MPSVVVYGMGVAVGDYDNNGFLSSHGPLMLLGFGGYTKPNWVEVKRPPSSTLVEGFTDRWICAER